MRGELDAFSIHQAVHGYADGHRLLASSVRLPKDADRMLLVLSDLSGTTGGESFDPYLTCYPVRSIGCHAIARTWPAQEMPRPGCVWTHTLLIPDERLDGRFQPEHLLPLFRRPSLRSGFAAYQTDLHFRSDGLDDVQLEPVHVRPPLAAALMRALYGAAQKRVTLCVPDYSCADGPLLAAWRLRWGGLRRAFTFCGGARNPRTLDGDGFDLQAALEKDARRFDRGPAPSQFVPWLSRGDVTNEAWVDAAATACADASYGELQAFVERVGLSLPADTALFRPLVQAHLVLRRPVNRNAVTDLIALLETEFPDGNSGRDFKRAFLAKHSPAELDERSILRGLAFSTRPAAFDAADLDVRVRSSALWCDFDFALDLLTTLALSGGGSLAAEVIHGLASALPPHALGSLLDGSPEVVAAVFDVRPELATAHELWTSGHDRQLRLAAAVALRRDLLTSRADGILAAALDSAADPINPDLIEAFGSASVATVLSWLDADARRPRRLPPGWRGALARRIELVVEWLRSRTVAHVETVSLIFDLIGGDALADNDVALAVLATHVSHDTASASETAIALAGRLLRASLTSRRPAAVTLAAACLDVVYDAAAASRLPTYVWDELTAALPDGRRGTWDRCAVLRAGVAEKFRSGQWPASNLVAITRDPGILRGVVEKLKNRRSGRRVLEAAAALESLPAPRELLSSE